MEIFSITPFLADIKVVGFWLAIGIAAGLLARAILPGEQKMNIFLTMILGIGGALIGGFVSRFLPIEESQWWMTLIVATGGAFILLVIVQALGFFNKKA